MLTDKQIFDAIRERRQDRGHTLDQEHVDILNALMYPERAAPAATYDRQALEDELALDEGKRLKAYRDTVGKWTIGIGRNLDDVGAHPLTRSVRDIIANGISEYEQDRLFDYDINRTVADLDRELPWWRSLDPVRQRVMINMCFNLGITGLCGFKNTLGMIQRKEYSKAADNMLQSNWARQVGKRANRLSEMIRKGRK
jgi:lysozyme